MGMFEDFKAGLAAQDTALEKRNAELRNGQQTLMLAISELQREFRDAAVRTNLPTTKIAGIRTISRERGWRVPLQWREYQEGPGLGFIFVLARGDWCWAEYQLDANGPMRIVGFHTNVDLTKPRDWDAELRPDFLRALSR